MCSESDGYKSVSTTVGCDVPVSIASSSYLEAVASFGCWLCSGWISDGKGEGDITNSERPKRYVATVLVVVKRSMLKTNVDRISLAGFPIGNSDTFTLESGCPLDNPEEETDNPEEETDNPGEETDNRKADAS